MGQRHRSLGRRSRAERPTPATYVERRAASLQSERVLLSPSPRQVPIHAARDINEPKATPYSPLLWLCRAPCTLHDNPPLPLLRSFIYTPIICIALALKKENLGPQDFY